MEMEPLRVMFVFSVRLNNLSFRRQLLCLLRKFSSHFIFASHHFLSVTFFPAKPRGSLLILFSAHARSAVTVILVRDRDLNHSLSIIT